MEFTGVSVNLAGDLSAADISVAEERPLSINAQTCAARFIIDLQAAQLILATGGLGTALPDVPLEDQETSDISEELPLEEQMLWLGVTLQVPIELRSEVTVAATSDNSVPLVPSDATQVSRAELTHWIKTGPAPVGEPREAHSAAPRSESIDPVTVDGPTLDPGLRSAPETTSPAIISPSSTIEERLLADSTLDDVRIPTGDQTPAQPTVDVAPKSFDAPASEAENTVTVDRPTGFVSVPPNDIHTNISHTKTQSSHSPRGILNESRMELSEVVRHVRTMVTEHETRTTIQLEPAELGRLTLELVDAPQGLRAFVSAEDPAVMRFLERSVKLLETEARLQGVGLMSFSVGADAPGGHGRGDQRQSEAEASFRKNIEWNTAPHAKPRSRRELDTNA